MYLLSPALYRLPSVAAIGRWVCFAAHCFATSVGLPWGQPHGRCPHRRAQKCETLHACVVCNRTPHLAVPICLLPVHNPPNKTLRIIPFPLQTLWGQTPSANPHFPNAATTHRLMNSPHTRAYKLRPYVATMFKNIRRLGDIIHSNKLRPLN